MFSLIPFSVTLSQKASPPYYGGKFSVKKGDSIEYHAIKIINPNTKSLDSFKLENGTNKLFDLNNKLQFDINVLNNTENSFGTNEIYFKAAVVDPNEGTYYSPIIKSSLSSYYLTYNCNNPTTCLAQNQLHFTDLLQTSPIIPSFNNQENAFSYLNTHKLGVVSTNKDNIILCECIYSTVVNYYYQGYLNPPLYNLSIAYNWHNGLLENYELTSLIYDVNSSKYVPIWDYKIVQTSSTNLIDNSFNFISSYFPEISAFTLMVISIVLFVNYRKFKKIIRSPHLTFPKYLKHLAISTKKKKVNNKNILDENLKTIEDIIKETTLSEDKL